MVNVSLQHYEAIDAQTGEVVRAVTWETWDHATGPWFRWLATGDFEGEVSHDPEV